MRVCPDIPLRISPYDPRRNVRRPARRTTGATQDRRTRAYVHGRLGYRRSLGLASRLGASVRGRLVYRRSPSGLPVPVAVPPRTSGVLTQPRTCLPPSESRALHPSIFGARAGAHQFSVGVSNSRLRAASLVQVKVKSPYVRVFGDSIRRN